MSSAFVRLFWKGVPAVVLLSAGLPPGARAQEKVTYVDHVLPLVEQHCAKCHNPDKKKGDLDLTSYSGALKGGGTGAAVVAGNVDSSKLIKVLTHAEEPAMPPNKPPLPEKELAVFKKWVAGGLLETSGSKAIAAARPAVDLTLKVTDLGRPDGPLPMPGELPIESFLHATRSYAVNALAASPWAPLVAIGGQKQILLYNTATFDLLGILPFAEGQPQDLKFSRSGKLLLAGGGHGAKSGSVTLWNVESGERIGTIGKEYDAVLAADISPDQARVALGGPDRLVKICSTKSGEVEHKIKKHTDWITALAFSPNGEMLASADRNGGLTVWDADNGQELFTTAGHKSAVTALSWRGDSKVIASSSEDGTVKLWETAEGKQAKSWNAHSAGALCVAYSRDGRLVSSGRDGTVIVWNAEGARQKAFESVGEMALRCVWVDNDERVAASDFAGNVALWDARSGRRLGQFDANPPPLHQRIARLQARIAELKSGGGETPAKLTEANAALAKLETEARLASTKSEALDAEFKARAQEVARLKDIATKPNPPADIEALLASARTLREQSRAARAGATNAVAALSQRLSAAKAQVEELRKARNSEAELARAEAELEKLKRAQSRASKPPAQQQSKR